MTVGEPSKVLPVVPAGMAKTLKVQCSRHKCHTHNLPKTHRNFVGSFHVQKIKPFGEKEIYTDSFFVHGETYSHN